MVTGIHHVYVETHNFGKTARFWQSLGFRLDEDRGTSGLLRPPDGGPYVYIAEVPATREPRLELYLASADETRPSGPVEIVAPFADTHWGTREMAVRDPDGRTLKLEVRTTEARRK
jgi:catechol 2,3-dioxygenase-like lactoylglutathione lyase family enzyme